MAEKTGACMCGAVRFTAKNVPDTFGICHCEMCRRWTGSALMNVVVQNDAISWEGEAQIGTLQSSDWAERAWCRRCGSNLYYRMTGAGNTDIPLGLFDDPNIFSLKREIFVDEKPTGLKIVDEGQATMTRAECMSYFENKTSE